MVVESCRVDGGNVKSNFIKWRQNNEGCGRRDKMKLLPEYDLVTAQTEFTYWKGTQEMIDNNQSNGIMTFV
jgi:hypothetical protein